MDNLEEYEEMTQEQYKAECDEFLANLYFVEDEYDRLEKRLGVPVVETNDSLQNYLEVDDENFLENWGK